MSKLDLKSLKCIFLGYCPSPHKYLVYADITFLKNAPSPFSQSSLHTNQGDDDSLIYTIVSPGPAHVPA